MIYEYSRKDDALEQIACADDEDPDLEYLIRSFGVSPIPYAWFGKPGAAEVSVYSSEAGKWRFVVLWVGANGMLSIIVCRDELDLATFVNKHLYNLFDLVMRSTDEPAAAYTQEQGGAPQVAQRVQNQQPNPTGRVVAITMGRKGP